VHWCARCASVCTRRKSLMVILRLINFSAPLISLSRRGVSDPPRPCLKGPNSQPRLGDSAFIFNPLIGWSLFRRVGLSGSMGGRNWQGGLGSRPVGTGFLESFGMGILSGRGPVKVLNRSRRRSHASMSCSQTECPCGYKCPYPYRIFLQKNRIFLQTLKPNKKP
jgi:hypothetical protein